MTRGRADLSRREFLKRTSVAAAAIGASSILPSQTAKAKSPFIKSSKYSDKVMVIGMDGMDPKLVRMWAEQGWLPNFKKLMDRGQFGPLRTTMPPQSPVAWSSFITGCDPGGHGIFDFIHRDPKQFLPYLSTSRSFEAEKTLSLGRYRVPVSPGRVELMRRGRPFWSVLSEHGVPSTIFQIPANFPVDGTDGVNAISGMGTPDLQGSYGTFTYYTEEDPKRFGTFAGGKIVKIQPVNHKVEVEIDGPQNSFIAGNPVSKFKFNLSRDPREQIVRVSIAGRDILLRKGEWSEWIPLSFELLSMFASVAGMVRIYVKEVHPRLKIYVSPVNVDPSDPSLPLCHPEGYSREISESVGRFYTQGFPADSKALSEGVLSNEEYLSQAEIVFEESMNNFNHELNRFDEGLFFFYFSTIDQSSHMMWRNMDPSHPLYQPDESERVKNAMRNFYVGMDQALEIALSKVDSSTTLFALSDHGFSPFTREFNISTWLVQEGYTVLTDPSLMTKSQFYEYVDWSKTKAYALGINGIYMNVRGREKSGVVDLEEATRLKVEIAYKIAQVRDPATGAPVVLKAHDPYDIYSGEFVSSAPDLLVGYNRGYRSSDEAVLGKFPEEIVRDRVDLWAADHCVDPSVVPGMLISNKSWKKSDPALWDLAPTILETFGLKPLPEMTGRTIYSS